MKTKTIIFVESEYARPFVGPPPSDEMKAWLYKPWIGGKDGWILPEPLPPELRRDDGTLPRDQEVPVLPGQEDDAL